MEQVSTVMCKASLSQGKVAKEVGISSAAFNQWLKGKYKGDNNEVESKLEKWLAAHERRVEVGETLPVRGAYIVTPSGERVKGVCGYTQAALDFSIITGPPGVCKTSGIKSYAASSPNVWVATMRPDTAGVASCLEEISEAVGLKTTGRAARQSRDLSKRMAGTGGLLIIDEAQHLSLPALESIRSIYDVAEIGLVLCGNESVYARLPAVTSTGSNTTSQGPTNNT